MLIKKEVMVKRLQKKLEKIAERRKENANLFHIYLKNQLDWHLNYYRPTLEKAVKDNVSSFEWDQIGNRLPEQPQRGYYDESDIEHDEKKVKQNLAILDAIASEEIEIDKFKTSRTWGFESIFED
jgi:hypothetical protein